MFTRSVQLERCRHCGRDIIYLGDWLNDWVHIWLGRATVAAGGFGFVIDRRSLLCGGSQQRARPA